MSQVPTDDPDPTRPSDPLRIRTPSTAALLALALAACGSGATDPPTDDPRDRNGAPVIGAFPSVHDHDREADFSLSVHDPEGEPVQVAVVSKPAWLAFDSASLSFTGTPGLDRIGTSSLLVVTASDGRSTTRRQQSLTVRLGTSTLTFSGAWARQTPHDFRHDGNPALTRRVAAYGGFAGDSARAWVADFMESRWDTLGARLGVTGEDRYELPPGGRIQVFVDRYQGDGAYGYASTVNGWAFRDGVILMSPDAPRRDRLGYSQARVESLITHELMHVIEFALIGRDTFLHATDAWFREGIATYMGGLAPGGIPLSLASVSRMEAWRRQHADTPGQGNPIAVRSFSDFPPGVTTDTYYFWFAQAVRYLVADSGFGLGERGLLRIYDDVRSGVAFDESFALRTGVDLDTFEAEFWDRLRTFLGG